MGTEAALAFAFLWAVSAQEPKPGPQPAPAAKKESPRGAPPPQPIAGLFGFESVSTLVYASAPNRPHRLEADYVFPERVRWRLSAGDVRAPERHIHYRFGSQIYLVPPGKAESMECAGEERLEILRQMELRRALMLWPDGFEWKGEGSERTSDLGPLGLLRARFGAVSDLRPVEMAVLDVSGRLVDTFRAITWKESEHRTWPATMELWHAGSLVWKENVDSIQTATRFIDSYFVPGDRRDPMARTAETGLIRELEIPESCALRVELAAGTSWDEAQAELARLRGLWLERLKPEGLELERAATFEVSPDLVPTACILRLAKVPEKAPAGFTTTRKRKGLGLAVQGLTEAIPGRLVALRTAVPDKISTQTPYLRFDPEDGGRSHVLIVLPLAP